MATNRPRLARGAELCWYGSVLLALGFTHRVYFPTVPAAAWAMAGVLWGAAAVAFLLALVPALAERVAALGPWRRRLLIYPWLLVPLAPLVGMYAIAMLTMVVVYDLEVALPVAIADLLLALALAVLAARRPRARRLARLAISFLLLAHGLQQIPQTTLLWAPPSAALCDGLLAQPHVRRMTEPDRPQLLSYPYEVIYIPEEDLVAASFKMAGNLTLGFWDDPDANELVLVRPGPDGPVEIAVHAFGDLMMPEYMAYDPQRRQLALTRLGFGEHRLEVFDISRFPDIELVRSIPIDWEPHSILVDAPRDRLVAFSAEQMVVFMSLHDYSELGRRPLGQGGTGFVHYVRASHTPGMLLVSLLGAALLRYDILTGQIERVPVTYGGGDVVELPRWRRIIYGDPIFSGINVISTRSLRQIERIELDYHPRPIAADLGRHVVAIGDWYAGTVHLHRARDLEPIPGTVDIGPYVRNFAYDQARGRLFAASKCGIYQVDVDALLPGASPDRTDTEPQETLP